jgi:hypothetical protein
MLYYCGDNCSIVSVDGRGSDACDKVSACVAAGGPVAGPRPQNRKPSRMTEILAQRMFESDDRVCPANTVRLSDDAQRLLNDLRERDTETA